MELTHLDEQGAARMVDVGAKPDTTRVAVAAGRVLMRPETMALIATGQVPKGETLAVARVAQRVRLGGHDVPDATVRRRYDVGLRNFFALYCPLASTWRFYDNTTWSRPRLVAHCTGRTGPDVIDAGTWNDIKARYAHGPR